MIVQMKRLTLVAHKADEAAILSALQAIEAVEILPPEAGAAPSEALERAQQRVQKLSDAWSVIRPYAPKAGLLTAAPEATVEQITAELPAALEESDTLTGIQRELSRMRGQLEKNQGVIDQLGPWAAFPADMQAFQSAKTVRYFLGLIAASDVDRLGEIEVDSEYQIFGEGTLRAAVVACPAAEYKSVAGYLKSLDWTDFVFPKLSGTPAEAIRRLEAENARLGEEQKALQEKLAERAGCASTITGALDAAVIERDRAAAATELILSDATFQLEGWTRSDEAALVEKAVRSVTDAYYLDIREPAEDETPPSVVKNGGFVTPFEQVTNLYSRPNPKGMDATPYMAPFYVLLFGLMLSDTGYGLLLSIGCLAFIKLKKPTGMMGGLARVLFWGGLSTMIWGVLVGTFFGMDFDTLLGTQNLFPILVDPMDDPIGMLILCFGLGTFHILFGVALKMKMAFAEGDWQTAIFDNLSWLLIVVGLIVFAVPVVLTSVPAILSKIGMGMAIAGAAMILFMKGRASRNPVKRTLSGLGELYQITSYLSDILSYARLFALGIATGVIASVFNDLCGMLMGASNIILNILGFIVACALLVALHLFNLAINTLGAFVHCARLQYVEFYGKFYESGGRAFLPLSYKTKHVRLSGANQ